MKYLAQQYILTPQQTAKIGGLLAMRDHVNDTIFVRAISRDCDHYVVVHFPYLDDTIEHIDLGSHYEEPVPIDVQGYDQLEVVNPQEVGGANIVFQLWSERDG